MATNLRGQAALDFLMTYGWAIALVVIIAGVLFALGIFDITNFVGSKATGFAGVAAKGWKLAPDGTFTMSVSNQVGQPIQVNVINVTIGQNTSDISGADFNMNTGVDSSILNSTAAEFGSQQVGAGYTARVVILYTDTNSGFQYTSTGTVTGKISE